MIEGKWWERYPDRLAAEEASLVELSIEFSKDEAALRAGILRLTLRAVDIAGETVDLNVTYPDLYPYFRFEVDAPTLTLSYHQNPFGKNLCLMGRATDNWHVGFTIGEMIRERLPKVFEAARAETAEAVADVEEHQAEPISDYYRYAPRSMVLVEGTIRFDRSVGSGTFKIGTRDLLGPPPDRVLRGALTKVFDGTGRKIAEASQPILDFYDGRVLEGPWLRLETPPPVDDSRILNFLRDQDPRFKVLHRKEVERGLLSVGAVIFPEQHSWRDTRGDGWIFVCEFIHDGRSPGSKQ